MGLNPHAKKLIFSHTRLGFPLFLPMSQISVPARGKDKKTNSRTPAAHWPHVDPLNINITMTSPCHISAYSGFSRNVFFLNEVFSGE